MPWHSSRSIEVSYISILVYLNEVVDSSHDLSTVFHGSKLIELSVFLILDGSPNLYVWIDRQRVAVCHSLTENYQAGTGRYKLVIYCAYLIGDFLDTFVRNPFLSDTSRSSRHDSTRFLGPNGSSQFQGPMYIINYGSFTMKTSTNVRMRIVGRGSAAGRPG